jgi:amidase
MTDLAELDAVGHAELVRSGQASPLELVDAAIERIEKLNPQLNAVITPLYEEARAAARSPELPDGPFRGVPFLLKDIGATQAGQPTYFGNRALRDADYRAPADTYLGARFRRAGLVTLGKSNLPEMGLQTTTQPLAFGPTHNPWALEHSTNGSSGGSAAAVAAGLVPMAHANDGGGSIRLPAGWCGLVGLKPSRGRVPFAETNIAPAIAELVVSRSVRDTATLLDAVAGNEPGELFQAPPPTRPYASEVAADPGRLRIGVLVEAPGAEVHPECVKAVEATAKLLESLGHVVEQSFPEALFESERTSRTAPIMMAGSRMAVRGLQELLGRPVTRDDVEPYLWAISLYEHDPVPIDQYLLASQWQQGWVSRVSRWFAGDLDLLLTPTCCEPPPTLAEMTPPGDNPGMLGKKVGQHVAFTAPFNGTGQPAISLPLHWTPDGLPVGVHFVAPMFREDLLIRVAAQLEQAQPWADRRPPLRA